MRPARDETRARILWGIWMAILAIVIVLLAYVVREALLLIYISVILAIGFSPAVRWIEHQKLLPVGSTRFPRWLAILVLYFLIIGTFVAIASIVLPEVIRQGRALWAQAPEMFDHGQAILEQHGLLREHLTIREVVARAPGPDSEAVGRVAHAAKNVAGGLFGIFTILILTLYILLEAASLRSALLRVFPDRDSRRVEAAGRSVTVKVSAWLTGQLLLSAVVGAVSCAGLWVLGVPFFYVLALMSGVGELIPIVGPILSAIPALAVALTISTQKAVLVLIFFIAQHQLENHVLVPRIMSRQVGVSPVTVIVALLIGGDLLGIVGVILAVPTAAVLQVIAAEVFPERH